MNIGNIKRKKQKKSNRRKKSWTKTGTSQLWTATTMPCIFGRKAGTLQAKQAHLHRRVVLCQQSAAQQALSDRGSKDPNQWLSKLVSEGRQQRFWSRRIQLWHPEIHILDLEPLLNQLIKFKMHLRKKLWTIFPEFEKLKESVLFTWRLQNFVQIVLRCFWFCSQINANFDFLGIFGRTFIFHRSPLAFSCSFHPCQELST